MPTGRRDLFTTVRTEGALLPSEFIQRLTEGDSDIEGLRPEDYHLAGGERINEAINRSWNGLVGAWSSFQSALAKVPETEPATRITREKWLLPLFRELGYGWLPAAQALTLDDRSYPVSHFWQNTPIHLVGSRINLDRRTAGVAGAARSSPHSLVQELLNRSDDHLWAFVANGLSLRILRDNVSLTRQAFVEFDIQSMMDGEVYADFVVLWLLCHQSRVEAEKPEDCWLERWSQTAREKGIRALEQLRGGVERAIAALGRGFLSHPHNRELKDKLRSGELNTQDYYRQLLRLVYRLLFLFVAEDRELLLDPKAPPKAGERYKKYYATIRLRHLAERRRGSRHVDLWRGLRLIFDKLNRGCPELALPTLGSFLWSDEAVSDIAGCDIANCDLLDSMRELAFTAEKNVRLSVDYKNLGSEELGSIYESLLELHPKLNVDAGTFELATTGGHERKTTGSYYTPTSLITCLLDSALDPVLEEATKKKDPENAILNLKICDPASGSGHFLIAAAHRMAKRLAAVRTGDEEPSPDATRIALRDLVGRCIYGVDINPMAVELCKVGLWMEALEPGKPLSFLDHHIKCGNSLLGTTPALIKKGVPDDAFKPIEGDDRKICQEYKKLNRKERTDFKKGQRTLDIQPWDKLGDLAAAMVDLDGIADDTIEGIEHRRERYEKLVHSSGYLHGHLLADAWCAAFIWKKTKEFQYPITDEVIRNIETNPHSVPAWMREEIKRLADQYKLFHWHLEFPDVFRVPGRDESPEHKETEWIGGFDVVLGNPPWERIKLQEKEWFAERNPDIAQARNAAERKRMIAALKDEDPELYMAFMEDKRKAEGESCLVRDTRRYPLCGRGDVNTYAVFAELKRSLISQRGRVGCIVPSGIATDDTTKFFFQDLIKSESLVSLYDFENRKAIFTGIHRSYKFCLLTLTGDDAPAQEGAEFVFFALGTEDLREEEKKFTLSAEDIELLNPNTRTCPIFRSKQDAELTKYIYRRVPVLIKDGPPWENPWGITIRRVFDMNKENILNLCIDTSSTGVTQEYERHDLKIEDQQYFSMYEAKLMWQFNHRYASYLNFHQSGLPPVEIPVSDLLTPSSSSLPRYWINEKAFSGLAADNWPRINWIIGYRDITNATNERTVVATILPKTATDFSLRIIYGISDARRASLFVSCLNSIIFDYTARQMTLGTHVSDYIIKQLPFIKEGNYNLSIKDVENNNIYNFILLRVLELVYTAMDLRKFANDCVYDGPPFRWDEERRFLIRAELDAAYFHLYLGNEAKWRESGSKELLEYFPTPRDGVEYIMETFPIVKRKDIQKYGEYRTKRVILEVYGAMAEAIRTGQPYQTILDPPPADPRVAHST